MPLVLVLARVEQVGEHGAEWVGGERLGSVHLPQQVKRGEALSGTRKQVGVLQEQHEHGAYPEVLGFAEAVVEGAREALERAAGARLLRQQAQQCGQLLRRQSHPSPLNKQYKFKQKNKNKQKKQQKNSKEINYILKFVGSRDNQNNPTNSSYLLLISGDPVNLIIIKHFNMSLVIY